MVATDGASDPTGDPTCGVAPAARGEEFLGEFVDDSVVLFAFEGETVVAAVTFVGGFGAHFANFVGSILRTSNRRGLTGFLSIFFGGIFDIFSRGGVSEEDEEEELAEETVDRTMF